MKTNKYISIILLVMVLLFTFAISVNAEHPIPDLDKKGTVSITMKSGEEIVSGGELIICRVGDVSLLKNGDFVFVPTSEFKDCKADYTNISSTDFSASLYEFIVENKILSATADVSNDGKAVFEELQTGLYLIYQENPADGYENIKPFVVGVPNVENGEYIYNFDASPKVSVTKVPPKPTQPLPQTGQLNWPVPVLAIAGVSLLLLGLVLVSSSKKKNEA